jgi:hypothetical protein
MPDVIKLSPPTSFVVNATIVHAKFVWLLQRLLTVCWFLCLTTNVAAKSGGTVEKTRQWLVCYVCRCRLYMVSLITLWYTLLCSSMLLSCQLFSIAFFRFIGLFVCWYSTFASLKYRVCYNGFCSLFFICLPGPLFFGLCHERWIEPQIQWRDLLRLSSVMVPQTLQLNHTQPLTGCTQWGS